MRHILPTFIAIAFVSACTFISAEEKGLQLTMDSTAYDVNSIGWLEILNFTDQPLYLRGCTAVFPYYEVQKLQADGSFVQVFRNTCSTRPPGPRIVDVESRLVAQLRIRMDLGRGGLPTGTYRIQVSLHRDAAAATPAIDPEKTVSKTFFVR